MKDGKNNELHNLAEKYVLDTIRDEHPNWVNQQGECPKCEEDYEALSDMIMIEGVSY